MSQFNCICNELYNRLSAMLQSATRVGQSQFHSHAEGTMNTQGIEGLGNGQAIENPISYALVVLGVLFFIAWLANNMGLLGMGKPLSNSGGGWTQAPRKRDGDGSVG